MRILIAPDSLKGSASAPQAADAIAEGVERGAERAGVAVEVRRLPLADGGEGFAEAMTTAMRGRVHRIALQSPAGVETEAPYGIATGPTGQVVAILDAASAIGLPLVPPALRQPQQLSSSPLARLIRAAARHNPQHIILGVGGTATMDMGLGALETLGALPLGHRRGHIAASPGAIPHVTGFDIRPRSIAERLLRDRMVTVACDVTNPLFGPNGAAHTFGPQKGADADAVGKLDTDFALFASRFRTIAPEVDPDAPGMGAAGGIPFGFAVALNARVRPGFEVLADTLNLDEHVAWADLVITGEGAFDAQSLHGKVVGSLARRALARDAASVVLVLAGRVDPSWQRGLAHDDPLRSAIKARAIAAERLDEDESMRRAAELLRVAAEEAFAEVTADLGETAS